MKRLGIKCTLRSDLIISSNPANEGFYKSLDYIPGSKFLGIVAQSLYEDQDADLLDRTLALFHKGSVRFGDAHPLINGKLSYKSPLSWNHPKKDKLTDGVFLYHHSERECPKPETETEQEVRVQVKDKYFTLDQKFIEVDQVFSIKSAYNREEYRSMDNQMYGYFSLRKGTQWLGYVEFQDPQYEDLLKNTLSGPKRIGRSRTAQYGLVDIEIIEEVSFDERPAQKDTEAYVYAYSNLCFVDEWGNYTLQPTADQLGLPPDSEILWEKSQIRSRKYQSWNKKRHSPNQVRHIIQKGSVFAVDLKGDVNTTDLNKTVGVHRSEGFGKILINPSFLLSDQERLDWNLTRGSHDRVNTAPASTPLSADDQQLLAFLVNKRSAAEQVHDIDEVVNDFVADYGSVFAAVSSSQWGQVRNIAKNAGNPAMLDQLLFNKEFGFLHTGQGKNQWQKKNALKTLRDKILAQRTDQQIPFTVKLAAIMAKVTPNNFDELQAQSI
jgi:hypothetical protein